VAQSDTNDIHRTHARAAASVKQEQAPQQQAGTRSKHVSCDCHPPCRSYHCMYPAKSFCASFLWASPAIASANVCLQSQCMACQRDSSTSLAKQQPDM
jgi:hypothetical protein